MKILAFSDWRVQDPRIALQVAKQFSPDVVLYAGDDVIRFNNPGAAGVDAGIAMTIHDIVEFVDRNYLEEIGSVSNFGIGAVIGNDCYDSHRRLITGDNVFELHSNSWDVDSFRIIGLEGATSEIEEPYGYTLYSGYEISQHLYKASEGVQGQNLIVVSHNPPYGSLDVARRHGVRRIGSKALREFIDDKHPLLVICGHVHLMGGLLDTIGATTVVNIASHDDGESSLAKFAMINITDDRKVECKFYAAEEHSIRSIIGIGWKYSMDLEENNITRPKQLILPENQTILDGIAGKKSRKWIDHYEVLQSQNTRVNNQIELPDDSLFIDIETGIERSNVWLIGTYHPKNGIKQFHNTSSSDNVSQIVVAEFLEYLSTFDSVTLVSYSTFDIEVLSIYIPSSLKKFFRKVKKLDLLTLLRRAAIFPAINYKLSTIARLLEYPNRQPQLNGLLVGLLYSLYVQTGEVPDWESILDYNKDDVMSMPYIVSKVNSMFANLNDDELIPLSKSLEEFIDKGKSKELRKAFALRRKEREVERKRKQREELDKYIEIARQRRLGLKQ